MTAPATHPADLQLVRDALAGREPALGEFIGRLACVPRILAARNQRLGGPLHAHELADLVQDTIVILWRKLAGYAGRSALETWIFSFCEHTLMNAVRRARKVAVLATDLEHGLPEAGVAAAEPGELAFDFVYQALDQLGAEDRAVIWQRHFEDRSFEEIAAHSGMLLSTVRSRYYRALERLRAHLDGQAPEAGA